MSARDIPMRRGGWWALAALLLAGGAIAGGYWLHDRAIMNAYQASPSADGTMGASTKRAETRNVVVRISSALATPEVRSEPQLSQAEASDPNVRATPSEAVPRSTDDVSADGADRAAKSGSSESLRDALRKARSN